jgi:hypothetical protein
MLGDANVQTEVRAQKPNAKDVHSHRATLVEMRLITHSAIEDNLRNWARRAQHQLLGAQHTLFRDVTSATSPFDPEP